MKTFKILLVALLISVTASAQNVGINLDGAAPDSSAILDLKSTSKGFLPPRVSLTSTADVSTISSPATGLLVYNIATVGDVSPGYYYFNGSLWVKIGIASQISQWTPSSIGQDNWIFYTLGAVVIGSSIKKTQDAVLEINSTTKGFLPPRMTKNQRNNISPHTDNEGMTIYNTSKKCLETYDGDIWTSNNHEIGEPYGGGVIFYIYDKGKHGLIAPSPNPYQGSDIEWSSNSDIALMEFNRDGVFAGKYNTEHILAKDNQAVAARYCAECKINGFGDWYLPSAYELNLLYLNKWVIQGFSSVVYWSSSEEPGTKAVRCVDFNNNGSILVSVKDESHFVCPIRAF